MPDLLIELFSEEIPARMQARAAEDLQKRVTDGLVEAGLTYAGAAAFVTPRRLTLTVHGLLAASPTRREERKGPRVDAPDKAIEGFLRGAGVSRDQLKRRDEKKGTVFYLLIEKPGRPASDIVCEVLGQVIRNFPWPKSMRWGGGVLRWVRPLRAILCVLSDESGVEIVPFEIDGIVASDLTYGHRFMAPGVLRVTSFDAYKAALRRAYVMLDPAERRKVIWNDATNQAFALGLEVIEDQKLLAEVAGLVEWPVVLMGEIDPAFLALPDEVLKTSMKEHQKFFSVRDPKSEKIERFITVANRETADQGATILAGNKKVLSARLADAKFFWENDLRVAQGVGLSVWTEALANVTFHNKLGSEQARIERIAALARYLAPVAAAHPDLAEQAARVAKADLASEMVHEFPELQGLMGRYYATAAGLPADVANACEAHYAPLGPSDAVPTAPVSVAVALADKLDKLTGFWAIDEKPTGSKDPFALRRAALGVIRLLLENGLSTQLKPVFAQGYLGADAEDLLAFFHDRLKVYLRDKGIRHDVIDACAAMTGNDDLTLLAQRAVALSDFLHTKNGENLLQAFKRANNILTQAETKDGVEYSYDPNVKFAKVGAEQVLFDALAAKTAAIETAVAANNFAVALSSIAGLRGPLDGFFEAVPVNDDNPVIRRNRLNLMSRIRAICLLVADFTRLEG